MQQKHIKQLNEKYNLELDKIIKTIKQKKAKNILIQLPDGLKPYATPIVDHIEQKTSANISIWLGTCFGACDIPETNSDLIIQFGHAPWKYEN